MDESWGFSSMFLWRRLVEFSRGSRLATTSSTVSPWVTMAWPKCGGDKPAVHLVLAHFKNDLTHGMNACTRGVHRQGAIEAKTR